MEDNGKKVIQISLNKFIILVILLIVVLGLGIGLYVNALKKSNTESEMQSMNEKENSVNEITKNEIENSANENNIDLNGNQVNNNNKTTVAIPNEKDAESNDNISVSNEEVKYPTSLGAIFSYTNSQINSSVANKTSDITYLGGPLKSNPYEISDDRKSITILDKKLNFEKEIYHACIYPIEQGGTDMWAILFRDGTVKYTTDYGETMKDGGNHIIDIFSIQYKRDTGDEIGSIIGSTILVVNEYGALTDLGIK